MPPTKSPGPANFTMKPLVGYTDHDFNSLKRRAPQWTMGGRPEMHIESKSPGPAICNIEKFTRYGKNSSAAAIMNRRPKDLRADANPGPTYSAVQVCLYKSQCSPKYSVRQKVKPLSSDPGPGPSADSTSFDVYKPRAPKYPLFHKHKELTLDKVPGPYDTTEAKKKVMYQNPAYSHRWMTVDPLTKKDKKPGAAEYNLMTYNPFDKNPAYTMRKKHCEYVHVPVLPFDNC